MDNAVIHCKNSGLVLLNSYILMLFNRLELTENDKFKDAIAQQKAVLSLQYIATGQANSINEHLNLNKVLCGLPLSTTINSGITFSSNEIEQMNGLLSAMISYWKEIGETSIDGFRVNWLVRDGILKEDPEKWDITVERRAYDVLLNYAPFSFSMIKLPWMLKPLEVTWLK